MIFQLYNEPQIFTHIIEWFSGLNYFFILLTAGYIGRLIVYARQNIILSHTLLISISFLGTVLNYFNIFTFSFLGILIIYSALAYLSYKLIKSKSLKWINLSMALFIVFIIGTYNLFNTKIHEITYPYFSTNDVLVYKFEFKPYFQIYRPEVSDLLGKVTFEVDNTKMEIKNDPIEFRIYAFYYVLNTIAVLFWLFIYFDILKKHNLKFKKIRQESRRGLLWHKPFSENIIIHRYKDKI